MSAESQGSSANLVSPPNQINLDLKGVASSKADGSLTRPSAQLSDEELVAAVAQVLRARGRQTLSFAESCTGGLLSAIFASVAGVSDVYLGSIVTYSNQMKEQVLHVPPSLLRTMGAVSEAVACAMAHGVKEVAGTQWAVSITGIAGPGGGSSDKPVGSVCFAWVGPGVELVERQQFSGSRGEIQKKSARHALESLLVQLGFGREEV